MKRRTAIAVICMLTSPVLAADQSPADSAGKSDTHVRKVEKAPNFTPAQENGMIGDWQAIDAKDGLVAQVYQAKDGHYQADLLKAFDIEKNVITVLNGTINKDQITFTGDGWTAELKSGHLTGTKGDQHFDLQRIVRTSPTLGMSPPLGATVLFDGRNLDAWAKKAGKDWLLEDGPAKWKLVDGNAVEVIPGTDCIITHQKFGDCHLHVEFRTIGSPSKSAVFLETRYEININETYGHVDGNMTGGMDNTTAGAAPRVRAALPPLVWQTFDVDFQAPRFNGDKKTENPRMTVLLNGVELYKNQELDPPHGAAGRLGEAPTGPLMLQDHLTPLQYRNIWIVPKETIILDNK